MAAECLLSDPPAQVNLVGYCDFKNMLAYRLGKEKQRDVFRFERLFEQLKRDIAGNNVEKITSKHLKC